MKHMIKRSALLLIVGIFWITGCQATGGSGSNATENQTTRVVKGSLATTDQAGLKATHLTSEDGCAADAVIATATNGQATSSEVESDCSFSLTLAIGKSYVISFTMDEQFLATLIFDSGISGDTTSTLPLSSGGELDLGTITINGNAAIPENEPLDECDYDDDGEDDLEDNDDDNDGEFDEDEEDCDFDGFLDYFDEDDSECEEENEEDSDHAHVLSVKPYDDPDGFELVDLERDVKARIECEVDQSSVNAETFYVVSEDGEHQIECSYEFSGSGEDGSKIECDHDDFEDFLPDTFYVANIDGVMCMDGRPVEAMSWTWLTEAEDDDEGSYEDELDDLDELEDLDEDEEDDEDMEDEEDAEDELEDEDEDEDETDE